MDFHIKRCGKTYVVEDDAGIRHSGLLSFDSAQARRDALEMAERVRLHDDPGAQERRQKKAAYREADRDSVLRMLKNFLPRKGQIERDTQAAYKLYLQEVVAAKMTIVSSDPKTHTELNKSPGQRRVSPAANARRQEGDPTREEVKRRWKALELAGMPEGKRASQIEQDTDIKNVRRIVRELGLKTKKRA
jgi:hypothetical protein